MWLRIKYNGLLRALGVSSVLLCFYACSPRVLPPAEKTDSIRVEIHERVVRDTAFVTIEREVERIVTRDTLSRLQNRYAKSEARVDADGLHHSLETIPQDIKAPVTVTVRDTLVVEKEAVKEYIEVNRLTEAQAAWIRMGKVLLVIDLLIAILAALTLFLRLKR